MKDLLVVLKAKTSEFVKGFKEAISVTQVAATQINTATQSIQTGLKNAFSGETRGNIQSLTASVVSQKEEIIKLESKVNDLRREQERYAKGSSEYEAIAGRIQILNKRIREQRVDLSELNNELSINKKRLADARLASEDNRAVVEATSRAFNAASNALLLFSDDNEKLKPIIKGLSNALALVNAAIFIQNLSLKENAVLMRATTAISALYTKATTNAAGATVAFRQALVFSGLLAAIAAIGLLAVNYDKIVASISKLTPEQQRFNKLIEETAKASKEGAKNQAEFATEVKYLKAIATSANTTLKAKTNAYERLVELVPELSKYTLDQANKTGILNKAIENQIELIGLQAQAQALFNTIVAEEQAKIELQQQKEGIKKLTDSLKEYNKLSVGQKMNVSFEEFQNQKNILSETNSELEKSNSLYGQLEKIQERILSLQSKTVKLKKPKAEKKEKESIDSALELAIQETKINAERLLNVTTSEREKVNRINATEEEIIRLRQASSLQQINIQNLGSQKSQALFNEIELDKIKVANDAQKRLKDLRYKEIQQEQEIAENLGDIDADSLDGRLKLNEEKYEVFRGILAKQYIDNVDDLKKHNEEKLLLEQDYLKERIRIYKESGVSYSREVQKLADVTAQIETNSLKEKEQKLTQSQKRLANRSASIFEQEFKKLGSVIIQSVSDGLTQAFMGIGEISEIEIEILKQQQKDLEASMNDATKSQMQMLQDRKSYLENEQKLAEATQSAMAKTFNAILVGVADFLQQLGIGLIAAALATEAFQKLLLTNPVAAAAAGAAAVVASAGVRAVLAKGVKFADGGIVSGPTLGLVGEYPGASTNPEVIAPLDKLQKLIGGTNNSDGGFIAETRISGRDLALVLSRYEKDLQRG